MKRTALLATLVSIAAAGPASAHDGHGMGPGILHHLAQAGLALAVTAVAALVLILIRNRSA